MCVIPGLFLYIFILFEQHFKDKPRTYKMRFKLELQQYTVSILDSRLEN